jgi:hypothetical protein
MNTIEEELWNYIDGFCGPDEKLAIEAKIATDLSYQRVYQDLLAVHHQLGQLDLDEPSMSFTRNVMEQVALEARPVVLQTKIDHRIVYTIGSLFILSILGIFGYAISLSDWNFSFAMPTVNLDTSKLFTPLTIQIFVFVDVTLLLIYLDSLLRKGKLRAQKKGV